MCDSMDDAWHMRNVEEAEASNEMHVGIVVGEAGRSGGSLTNEKRD